MKKIFHISVFILLTILILGPISRAETVEEIQAKIDVANSNRDKLLKEIAGYQQQLQTISTQANTLQTTIKSLDVSTNKITTEVKLTESDISKTTLTIKDTGLAIKDKENQINSNRLTIAKLLKQTNELDSLSLWEIILSNKNLSDFWSEIEDNIQVQAKMADQVVTVRSIKLGLEKAQIELEKQKKELQDYTTELNAKKNVLLSTKKEKSNLLTTTKNTEANYQKILQDKLALKEALDRELASFESQLKISVDPKSFPSAGKGILSWPLDTIYITQNFGKTSYSGRLYVTGTHNGVDFRAPIGTRVKSAGNGVVEAVGDTDKVCPGASYGKWVFIRYDNGLASTYGHLSLISSAAGQKVKAGDVVGYSGSSGYSTGPHLHMSVYPNQAVTVTTLKSSVCKGTYTIPITSPQGYLDPLIYL
ncbi:MAG: peptidoglycan DD-metalloendopeptidase family protein [Candidatus Paceibacterota bacterium]